MPIQCLNPNISDIYTFGCPSHGWQAIQEFIYLSVNSQAPEYGTGIRNNPDWVEVTGHSSQRRLSIAENVGHPEGYDPQPVVATTQQSVVADVLSETGTLWLDSVSNLSTTGHGSILQRQDAVHAINSGYYQPYTMASCANDVIRGPHDDSAVAFPLPPGVSPSLMLNQSEYNDSILDMYSFVYPGVIKNQILGTPGSLMKTRLKWVELPQDPFNGSAIGAIILLPHSSVNRNLTQEIIVCNLGAGWGSSLMNTSSFDGGMTSTLSVVDPSSIIPKFLDSLNQSIPGVDTTSLVEVIAGDSVTNYYLPSFPQKPIIVTEAWANYLNPFVPALNTTLVDVLMSTVGSPRELKSSDQTTLADWVLAGLLANGLASIGATGTLQGNIKTVVQPDGSSEMDGDYWFSGKGDMFIVDPEESKDWVRLRVDSTIDGYAYNIRGASPKVAISFLLTYCIITLSHVLYAEITGKEAFGILILNAELDLRYFLHMLGFHRRSHRPSHELHPHGPPQEHLRRHHGAQHL